MGGNKVIEQVESTERSTIKTTSFSVEQAVDHKQSKMIAAVDAVACTEQSDACHNLLNTTELLENILSQLPIKDLLFAQRVCKTWKNCIDHSTTLQRGLFFAPTDLEPTDIDGILFQGPSPTGDFAQDSLDDRVVDKCSPMRINPLLRTAFGLELLATNYLDRSRNPRGSRFTRPEASWKRMNISYPALTGPDALLSIKRGIEDQRPKRVDSSEDVVLYKCLTEVKERLMEEAIALITLAFTVMRRCETADQLAGELRRFERQKTP
ncbi:hypothetical protein BST61_g10912 [Cercospora zeina]